jgi:ankyrin repeat protein
MLSYNEGEHPSTRGTTAFHLAAEYPPSSSLLFIVPLLFFDMYRFGFYDCFLACTNVEGVDIWMKTGSGATALHLACKHGHVNIVEHILSTLHDKCMRKKGEEREGKESAEYSLFAYLRFLF